MARKLQAYVRKSLHVSSKEILASNHANLESLDRRTRARIHASTMLCHDQAKELEDQLHDLRKEICQLIKKEGAKQGCYMAQILEELQELNTLLHKAFLKEKECGDVDRQLTSTSTRNDLTGCTETQEDKYVLGSLKKKPEEEVSESGNQDHFKDKVFEQDHDQTRENCFNSGLQNSPKVACRPCVLLKNSTVSLQPQRINTCHHMCSPIWKQCSIAASDQAEALAFDTESNWNENRPLEKSRPSNEVNGQFAHVLERDKIWALDAKGKVHELSCIQDQQGKMLHTRESLGHYYWNRQILYNVNGCIKMIESYIPPHSTRARKAVATENLVPDLYDNPWEAFLFMKNHAGPQAAVERVDPNDMEETHHHEEREVPSKRRIRYQSMKSSKTQQSCTGNGVLMNKGVRKRPWSTSMNQLQRRRPICHFTRPDVERLVRAVEKFGTGRWRDIKENYFSLEKHRSAADLKDKWRSLLHSAKLAPEQRRCVKLASVLVKRILAIDEEEKSRPLL